MVDENILDALKDKSNKEYFIEQIESIKQDSRIIRVCFDKEIISFYTKPIIATDIKKNLYAVGKMKINLNLQDGQVTFKNLDGTHDSYQDNMHAPHVYSNGTACWGTASKDITEFLAKFEVAEVIFTALNYLEVVNINDTAGKAAKRAWPRVKI